MAKRKQPSVEEKLQAVMALLRKEEPAVKIARRFNISETSLYRWRDDFLEGGKQSLIGKRAKSESTEIAELKKEIETRDQVIGEITIANRILKKIQDGLL